MPGDEMLWLWKLESDWTDWSVTCSPCYLVSCAFIRRRGVTQICHFIQPGGKKEAEVMADTTVTSQPRPFVTMAHRWSSGICDCWSDLSHCCFAFWCFPCFACITAREAGECLCLPLLDSFGAIPPITTALRVSVRQRYGIEGSICKDCVYACFCRPCSWCQISREMKKRMNPVAIA